jgi:serine/threonine protein phosphatase PrpC
LTDVLSVKNINKGDYIILMSDGMYDYYKKYISIHKEDYLFPKDMDPLKIKVYFQKIISIIDFNLKGSDNCTLTVIQVPFDIKSKWNIKNKIKKKWKENLKKKKLFHYFPFPLSFLLLLK